MMKWWDHFLEDIRQVWVFQDRTFYFLLCFFFKKKTSQSLIQLVQSLKFYVNILFNFDLIPTYWAGFLTAGDNIALRQSIVLFIVVLFIQFFLMLPEMAYAWLQDKR